MLLLGHAMQQRVKITSLKFNISRDVLKASI